MSAADKNETNANVSNAEANESATLIPISEWPISTTEETSVSSQLKKEDLNEDRNLALKHTLDVCDQFKINSKKRPWHNSCSYSPKLEESSEIKSKRTLLSPHKCTNDTGHNNTTIAAKIARWWRQKRTQGLEHSRRINIPKDCGPNSMIHHISRLPECRRFLQHERRKLLAAMESSIKKADNYAALASLEDYMEDFSSALHYIKHAVQLEPSGKDYQWLKEKISRQVQVVKQQMDAKKRIEDANLTFPSVTEVPRLSGKTLTVADFQTDFLQKGKPVIITDVVVDMTQTNFDFPFVVDHAGNTKVTTKSATPDSVNWARLENERETTISQLIKEVDASTAKDVLFDWSLPLHCPSLAECINLPHYFKNNFLLQTAQGSLYRDSWPSLFIAPKGASTQLHVDAFHSHFWMALFQGEKRWTFFDQEDMPCLYPRWFQSMDPVFEVDLCQPDLIQFPLLALTRPQQCVLQKDELLFVPAGSPHFVENLTPTLAISSNYVDYSNLKKVCEELEINALEDQRASDLLSQLQEPAFLKRVENLYNKIETND